MKSTKQSFVGLLLTAALLFSSFTAQAGELRISVAASMTDLFKDLVSTFEQQHQEIKIITNFGPSGGLAKQIDKGAPADLYVSANPKWMNYLVEKERVDATTRKIFAHNKLVFVGIANKEILSLQNLPSLERIGIGSPKSVPAGQYAKEALDKLKLWDGLLEGGKLVMAKDVRQALIYADRGETDGSFVYRTDALLAKKAEILFEVPQELYSKVSYPVAITEMGVSNPEAKEFYNYVISEAAHEKLLKYGFSLPE